MPKAGFSEVKIVEIQDLVADAILVHLILTQESFDELLPISLVYLYLQTLALCLEEVL